MIIHATAGRRPDWKVERDRIDLAAVATRLLGPAPGRRGERGRRLWWHCPLHEDGNPSFVVDPGAPWWRCYGCGAHGDAADLVMKVEGKAFPEAVDFLVGGSAPSGKSRSRSTPKTKAVARPEPRPSGLPEADALALVEDAAARLWTPEGADALAYLTGARVLDPETIRAARLGVTPRVSVPKAGGTTFLALGVVVPWFAAGRLAMVKVRQPGGCRPKYVEAFRDPARLSCYPGTEAIRPGHPLVVVEGELDALLLGQALGDLAAVVTLGSASARPSPAILSKMLSASPWFIATDRDEAGEKAAADWPARARRVRPPEPFKDWSEAAASPEGTRGCGVDLHRWWSDILAGIERPPLYTWDELANWRWGLEAGDPGPGIIVPERGRVRLTAD